MVRYLVFILAALQSHWAPFENDFLFLPEGRDNDKYMCLKKYDMTDFLENYLIYLDSYSGDF